MKVSIAVHLMLISPLLAFTSTSTLTFGNRARTVVLYDQATKAIEAALEASQKFGPTSSQARVAWDTVEEINASRESRDALGGGLSDEECLMSDSEECRNYYKKLSKAQQVLEATKVRIEKAQQLVADIGDVRLMQPSPRSKKAVAPDALLKALQEAKELTEQKGVELAKTAWETVEEIASNDYSEVIQSSLDDECLIEALQACEAIEEMQRVINLQKNPSRYSG